jgi:hypothetical protein
MSIIDAWQALFSLSSGNTWVKIPDNIRKALNLDSRIGIMGGILCTQNSAIGASNFLNKLNSIGENRA